MARMAPKWPPSYSEKMLGEWWTPSDWQKKPQRNCPKTRVQRFEPHRLSGMVSSLLSTVPSGYVKIAVAIEHDHLIIVEFPIEHGGSFHSYVNAYRRVRFGMNIDEWLGWSMLITFFLRFMAKLRAYVHGGKGDLLFLATYRKTS